MIKRPFSILFMLLSLFLSVQVVSQNAEITILDKETNLPVPFATVGIKNIATQKEQFVISSNEGLVLVPMSKTSAIKVSCVGYKTLYDTIRPTTSQSLYLYPDIFNLNQLVITATRSEKALKNTPVITQVITSRQIQAAGLENLEDILEKEIPGIEFQHHGTSTDVNMQGLEGRNVLILIDGERIAGETRGNIDYARLNTTDIERVEIVKGASSALYGSGAMGAVINIISKQAVEKLYANVNVKYTNWNEVNYADLDPNDRLYYFKKNLDRPNLNLNTVIGFNLGKFGSKTIFSTKNTDGYILKDRNSLIKRFIDYDTVIYQAPSTTEIAGSLDYNIKQQFTYNFSKRLNVKATGSYYTFEKFDFYREDKKHDFFDDISLGLKASYTTRKDNQLLFSIHTDNYKKYDYKEILQKKDLKYSNYIVNPKLTANVKLSDKQQLIAGTEFLLESLLANVFVEDKLTTKQRSTYLFFLQDDYRFRENITFLAGVRGEYNSDFGTYVSPKISAMYKPKTFTFRLNYASGYRSPSLKELYYNWDHLGMFTIMGNPDLKPETNHYFSASVEMTKSIFNMSVNAYVNRFKNKIEGQWEDNQTIYRYQNIKGSSLKGVDYQLKVKLPGNFWVKGGYAYVNDKNRQEGIRLSSVSPHTANWELEYRLTKQNYQLTANLSGKYIGSKDFYVTEEIEVNDEKISAYYQQHYDGYAIWRFSVSQRLYHSAQIVFGIENLFDYTADIVTFNTSVSPGRRYFVSLNVQMDKLYGFLRK